jgi:Protein of unknown function (DUF 659)
MQHVKTTLHQERLKKYKNEGIKQQTIRTSFSSTSSNEFNFDLCKMMIQANIPLNKLENNFFRMFLDKYCHRHIPNESTLRKNVVSSVYKEILLEIKSQIGHNYIWFSVDETTDTCGRYVVNLAIGVLNSEIPTKAFIISSKELNKTNNNTVTKFVHDGLTSFFLPEPVPGEKILLMLSDAAPYMIKAGLNLKFFYENLIHCTCIAHGLNRIAETIRLEFSLVNKLIKNGKKIFVKAPLRVQLFKEKLPNVSLPPEPVLTRWGTWIDAAIYYANNFEKFAEFVFELPETGSSAIKDCQTVLKEEALQQNLAFIKSNYHIVSKTIKSLEKQDVPLLESAKIVNDFKDAICAVSGQINQIVISKLEAVFSKNEGFKILVKVFTILSGEFVEHFEMDPIIVANLKYAPITSVDIERSFSTYKNILSERRQNLTMKHLEQYLIINCSRKD